MNQLSEYKMMLQEDARFIIKDYFSLILCSGLAAAHPCPHCTLMPECIPCLVLGVPACWRMLWSSHRNFSRWHTYLSSLSSLRSPRVGVYHCLGRPCRWACTILVIVIAPGKAPLAGPAARRLRRAPTSAFACVVIIIVPGCAPEGRRMVNAGAQTAAAKISAVN